MAKKAGIVIAGLVTSVAITLGLGLAGGAHWFGRLASAASAEPASTQAESAVCVAPDDVATLQAQLYAYQAALQQADAQLQAAYDEIAGLQRQGGNWSEHEEGERGDGIRGGTDD